MCIYALLYRNTASYTVSDFQFYIVDIKYNLFCNNLTTDFVSKENLEKVHYEE